MGQKTDTKNILQIGKNNEKYIWDLRYYEKIKQESQVYIYKNLEIKKFIKKFLNDNGLILYKYKISFLESTVKIFISYLKLPKSKVFTNDINKNQKFNLIKKSYSTNEKKLKKPIKQYLNFKQYLRKKNLVQEKNIINNITKINKNLNSLKIVFDYFRLYKIYYYYKVYYIILNKKLKNNSYKKLLLRKILKYYLTYLTYSKLKNNRLNTIKQRNIKKLLDNNLNREKKKTRIKILQFFKSYLKIKNNIIIKNIKMNNFLEKIIESINLFNINKNNIVINLQQIDNNITFNMTYNQLKLLKKTIIQLRQFKKSEFFKEGINIIFSTIIQKNSAQLLANFIATQFKLTKRGHGFFIKFLKQTLSLIITNKISKILNIKILIKGRFNNASRSKKTLILINQHMPLMTIKSNINSTQTTAYGSNGTFGVKIWINYK